MADLAALMSTGKDDWQTPGDFLDALRDVAPLGLDPCAGASTRHAAHNWRTFGTERPWRGHGLCFVNPPYSDLRTWAEKVRDEAARGTPIALLIPSRTETRAFQLLLSEVAATCWLSGRLRFVDPGDRARGQCANAPFPSALLLFTRSAATVTRFCRVFRTWGVITGEAW